jgi:DNA-binding CsgD family transcriptional regulator
VTPQPGDYGVQRTRGLAAWAIRIATRSKFSHAFVVVRDGNVIEARGSGAVCRPLGVRDAIYSSDAIQLSPFDRNGIVSAAMRLVDTPYGWLDIISIGLLQYGIKPKLVRDRVQREDKLICSELVDLAYFRGGVHLFADGRLPMDVTPGDLAKRAGWRCPMATVDQTRLAPSPRQIQVAQLIADGCSIAEAAEAMGISRPTAKATLAYLGARLGCRTRPEIIVEMMRRGLVR